MSQKSTQKVEKEEDVTVAADDIAIENQATESEKASSEKEDKSTISEEAAESDEKIINKESSGSEEAAEDVDAGTKESEPEESIEDKYKAELAESNDKLMRLAAEFENYKKRTTQEMQNRLKFANQPLALNIITGLDNLERALDQAKDEENEQLKEFVRGVEMVQQQLHEALKQNNVDRVYPKGELFDPNKHEAMGVIETEEVEPDHIAEVFQAGYIMHDRVIRPAMVQVAKKKQ